VGTGGAEREEFVAAPREQDRILANMSRQHLSIGKCVDGQT
jgi:hypothetical protein